MVVGCDICAPLAVECHVVFSQHCYLRRAVQSIVNIIMSFAMPTNFFTVQLCIHKKKVSRIEIGLLAWRALGARISALESKARSDMRDEGVPTWSP